MRHRYRPAWKGPIDLYQYHSDQSVSESISESDIASGKNQMGLLPIFRAVSLGVAAGSCGFICYFCVFFLLQMSSAVL